MILKLITTITVLFISTFAFADVIWLHDGTILLGKIVKFDADSIDIESFGQVKKISQTDVLKKEKSMDEIILKDGSTIKGKIQNYDEEIGINVNIDFGSITLPLQSVKEVRNNVQKIYYNGLPVFIGISGGYYFLAGSIKERFNDFINFSIFSEFNVGVRGLFIGGDLQFTFTNYLPNPDVDFYLFSLQPYIMYKFMMLRKYSSFVKIFVPFVSVGLGVNYTVKTTAGTLTQQGEVDFIYNIKAGLDIQVVTNLWFRIYTGFESVPQKVSSFHKIPLNIAVMVAF
jgi:hypothetical protein